MLPSLEINLVDSVAEAQRFLSWLGERRPALAVDTETTGLEWDAQVRLVQFGDGASAWAVPALRWRGVAEEGLAAVRDAGVPVVMHNAQFDMHRLVQNGYPAPAFRNVEDTQVLARLHAPLQPAGLKRLCSRLFGREAVAGQALLDEGMRKNRWTWATVPDTFPPYWQYGALDTSLTALAFERLAPLVPRSIYDREMAVLEIMYGAEQRGMRVDPDYTSALLAEWQEEAQTLLALLQEQGIPNPSSNADVTSALRAAGWEPEEFTDTGLPRLDKAVLSALSGRYGELALPLLRYRRLVKWCSTYLERFLQDRDADDRLHPNIQTLAARTGRMSIRNPALQTLPSKEASIRNCVIPSEGSVLYAIDFSQIEMRMMAHFSGDPGLSDALRSEDLHAFCASLAYNVPLASVSKAQRSIAKNTNFARLYGAGPARIAQTAGVPVEDVKGYMTAFDSRFPGVSAFIDGVQRTAKIRLADEGEPYVQTSGGRRLTGDPDKIYALTNYLIQGSAADVFKSAVIAVDNAGLGEFIVCPIHDEILFDFPKGEAEHLAKEAQTAMEDHTSFSVPLVCEVTGPLNRWGEAYL